MIPLATPRDDYKQSCAEIIHTLDITFNEYFFQALIESWLSPTTKRELVEFLFSEKLRNKSQYRRSLSHARAFDAVHKHHRRKK